MEKRRVQPLENLREKLDLFSPKKIAEGGAANFFPKILNIQQNSYEKIFF